jgi:hypothetical protein
VSDETQEQDGAQPRRGDVGRQTYEAVQRYTSQGMKATEAFARVAEETNRSAATVATAYYRMARRDPNTTVRQRPRRQAAPGGAKTPARDGRQRRRQGALGETIDELVRLNEQGARLLADLRSQLADLERKAGQYDEISGLLGRR